MKKLFALAILSLSASAFSQVCEVDMVDRYNRVIQTFRAYGDANCMEGMKECRKAIRLGPQRGGVDCVRAAGAPIPTPIPTPTPNPYPPTNPNPYPPRGPGYGMVDANTLIVSLMSTNSSSEVQTKIAKTLIQQMNIYSFQTSVNLCAPTRSWAENSRCLSDAVRRSHTEYVEEFYAQKAIGNACPISDSWVNEANCFRTGLNYIPSLQFHGQTCQSMYNSESISRCYRQIFGN